MEERKRPATLDHDDSIPPAKRQAVTVNGTKSHSDADPPWKDDIEAYQKDAIFRQMKEYKRVKNELESQVAKIEQRAAYHDDHLRIIDLWFSQLVDEIKVLANQNLSPSDAPASSFPSSLLFADNEKFQEHLSSRSEKIKSALRDLFGKIPTSSLEVSQLQDQVTRLLAAEKEHIAELQQITTEKEQVQERFDMATHRYMIAEKKIDRLKSAQVAKLERQATAGGANEESSSTGNAEVNGIASGAASEELEQAHKEAMADADRRRQQLETLEAENKKLTEQVTSLSTRLAGLSDDDYAKTDLFKALKSQHEDVIKRINNLEATNVQLREEAQKLQAERTAYRIQVDDESRVMISESESNLAQSEANLARIRNSRDELVAELAVLKASQKDGAASTEQIKELASAKESRIAALESEVERLRLQIAEKEGSEVQQPTDLDSLSPEQLRSRIVSLESQYKLLSNELPSMEAAWKKASSLANKKIAELTEFEERVSRANADKAKADQKFFAAMKTKEAREQEVRILKAQAGKSTEVVAQLKESEAASRSLLDKADKQLAEMRVQMEELSIQHRALQQKLSEHQITTEGQANQVTELKKTLESKDSSYLEAKHAQRESEAEQDKLKVQLEEARRQGEIWKKKSLGNQSEEDKHMRAMLQCQVCKKEFKNTVIKTCGHVYCDSCVSERIQSRSRKCPGCGKPFGTGDVMRIHI